MIAVAALLGGLGLVCIIYRKTFLGFLIGVQLMITGATSFFILAGIASGTAVSADIFGLFIILGGVGQIVAGYALAVRLFYLRKKVGMNDLRTLKQ